MVPAPARIGIPEWTFGDRLRKIRREADLDQGQMATRLGISKGRYANWEIDTARPRDILKIAARIEVEFGTPRWWILGAVESVYKLPRRDSNLQPAD